MSDPENLNEITPSLWEVGRRLVQAQAGALKGMSAVLGSLMSTNLQMQIPTGSSSMNGKRSNSKPSEMAENQDLSSSAQGGGSSSTSYPQSEQEIVSTFIVQIKGYGYPRRMAALHLLTLARALWAKFGNQAVIVNSETNGRLQLDPKGDDSGHHADHTVPVIEVPWDAE